MTARELLRMVANSAAVDDETQAALRELADRIDEEERMATTVGGYGIVGDAALRRLLRRLDAPLTSGAPR